MNKKLKFVVFVLLVLASATAAFAHRAKNSQSRANQFRLGIAYGSSIFSNKEQFEFTIGGGQRVVLNHDNPTVYFAQKFSAGQTYSITQVSGPRTCSFFNQERGTFAAQDIVITASCGNPPFSIFKLQVTGIEQGEIFNFADNYRRRYQYPFSTTANLGGYPVGDDYSITQTSGPRQCRMSLNQGVVPNTPLIVKADCGKTTTEIPPPSPTGSFKDFELVSRSADDKNFGTFYDSGAVVIGGTGADEGRYVAFVSSAAGLAGASGKYRQIIWRDRKTGETRLVSVGMGGAEGNQNSFAPAMSADGKKVAFESYATNLTPDSNNVRDVFVWNYDTNTVTAVSENRGTEANSECFEPAISADGNLIAFSSSAGNLTPGVDGTSTVNVYLRDMRSGAVTLISKKEKDGKGGGGSRPSISEDGSRIAFYNYFPLTEEDKNNLWDIYVWQSGAPKLRRVTKTAAGGEKDQGDESASRVVAPTISGDGRFVAFSTTATNMFAGDQAKFQDAFLSEIGSGRITLLSVAGGAFGDGDSPFGQGERIALTADGAQAAFTTKAKNLGGSLVLASTGEGANLRIILPTTIDGTTVSVGAPSISQTGKCVAFGSNVKLDKRFSSSGVFVTCK